jgi:hypothetical protein
MMQDERNIIRSLVLFKLLVLFELNYGLDLNYTRGQLFLRPIWPRGQRHTLPSGHLSTVPVTVDTRRFTVFFVVLAQKSVTLA